MKSTCVVSFAILALLFSIQTQAEDSIQTEVEDTVLKVTLIKMEKLSWEAWQKRDGNYFQRFLSDDHVEVGFDGVTNKKSVVVGVASPMCIVKSYSVDNFELTSFNENTALLTYHARQDTTCNGRAVPTPAWVSSLYIRRDGRWLNALYQHTQDMRKP